MHTAAAAHLQHLLRLLGRLGRLLARAAGQRSGAQPQQPYSGMRSCTRFNRPLVLAKCYCLM